jgi:hypothetical protein
MAWRPQTLCFRAQVSFLKSAAGHSSPTIRFHAGTAQSVMIEGGIAGDLNHAMKQWARAPQLSALSAGKHIIAGYPDSMGAGAVA